MRQELVRNHLALGTERVDGLAKVEGVPQDDRGDHQGETAGAVTLVLVGAVADAGNTAEPRQGAKSKDAVRGSRRLCVVLTDIAAGVRGDQPLENSGRLTAGGRDDVDVIGAVALATRGVEFDPWLVPIFEVEVAGTMAVPAAPERLAVGRSGLQGGGAGPERGGPGLTRLGVDHRGQSLAEGQESGGHLLLGTQPMAGEPQRAELDGKAEAAPGAAMSVDDRQVLRRQGVMVNQAGGIGRWFGERAALGRGQGIPAVCGHGRDASAGKRRWPSWRGLGWRRAFHPACRVKSSNDTKVPE